MLWNFLLDLFKNKKNGSPIANDPPSTIALDDHNHLVAGRHGWFLANKYDQYLGRALLTYGESSEIEHTFLSSLLREDDCVVEVGANIGTHTIGLAKTVGPQGSVVAIEAQPAIFRILCANIALNGLNNITPHGLGCGSKKTTMTVPAIDYNANVIHNSGGISLSPNGSGLTVSIEPLDELLADHPSIRLLKIDVEGMEQEVLSGAQRLIRMHRPFLYVENDRIEKSQSLIEWIIAADYRLWWHIPPLFNLENFFGVNEDIYENIASFNMLCVPKEISLPLTEKMEEITDPGFHPLKNRT